MPTFNVIAIFFLAISATRASVCPLNTISNEICYKSMNCTGITRMPCKPVYICVSKCISKSIKTSTPANMRDLVAEHNRIRSIYQAKPLSWDTKLATSAQSWAARCKFDHDYKTNYGENLMWGSSNITRALYDAPRLWAAESKYYNYSAPSYSHFTQMVWKSTTQIGCAYKLCANSTRTFVVCRYYKAGNVGGQFPKNVARPVVV